MFVIEPRWHRFSVMQDVPVRRLLHTLIRTPSRWVVVPRMLDSLECEISSTIGYPISLEVFSYYYYTDFHVVRWVNGYRQLMAVYALERATTMHPYELSEHVGYSFCAYLTNARLGGVAV